MSARPGVAIYVTVGDDAPVVFYTALSTPELRAVDRWLAAHPDLRGVVEEAWRLAEEAADRSEVEDELAARRSQGRSSGGAA